MIEGTKPYRPRGTSAEKISPSTTNVEAPQLAADAANKEPVPEAASAPPPPGERSLGRRDWFRSLVPAFGTGLVEILRAGNNLERDLEDLRNAEGAAHRPKS